MHIWYVHTLLSKPRGLSYEDEGSTVQGVVVQWHANLGAMKKLRESRMRSVKWCQWEVQ